MAQSKIKKLGVKIRFSDVPVTPDLPTKTDRHPRCAFRLAKHMRARICYMYDIFWERETKIRKIFTVTAFQQPAWSSFQQPTYVAAPRRDTQCAYSQANLMPGQWNLDRVDGAAGRALDGYFAPPECLCGKNVFIYVLDTGARTTHEDFKPASRCATGWNFVGDACGGIVDDQSGHGTHVAATALGATSGVAKCANLVPVQILDGAGQGKGSYILSALDWVAEQDVGPGGRKIVSMSVGGPRSAVIDAAVREIVSSGIVVVAAAGNDAKDADGKFIFIFVYGQLG